ncbi:MAG: 4'-phosphopantetheinyl transferase superfamily protein [Lachnospiraceae bacterium]|nr:4'-phosphopantetheinyl transferase superfamily protein [Lachnospiraceae bacterium]
MRKTCYLLDVSDLRENEYAAESRKARRLKLVQEMEALLDKERLLKYEKLKGKCSEAECLGAGALLRLALSEEGRLGMDFGEGLTEEAILTPEALLKRMQAIPKEKWFEPAYRYGAQGKPYLTNAPYYVNLSHSGDLVALAISDHEIGIDVQKADRKNWQRIANRYFTAKDEAEFYRQWCRKEAYGKMTGEGVTPYLSVEVKSLGDAELFEGNFTLQGAPYYWAAYVRESLVKPT